MEKERIAVLRLDDKLYYNAIKRFICNTDLKWILTVLEHDDDFTSDSFVTVLEDIKVRNNGLSEFIEAKEYIDVYLLHLAPQ